MAHEPDLGQEVLRHRHVNQALAELTKQAIAQPLDGSPAPQPQQQEPQKLTVEAVEELDKSYDETFDVTLSSGHVITLRKKFRKTELYQLGDELVSGMNSFQTHHVRFPSVAIPYIMFLTIKHFSDLDIPDDFERQLVVLNMLIDNGMINEIFDSFDAEQRKILDKHLAEFANGIRVVTDGAETAKVEEEIINSEE